MASKRNRSDSPLENGSHETVESAHRESGGQQPSESGTAAESNAATATEERPLTPLEKARLARKAGIGSVRQVFYVLVGTSLATGAQDILSHAKSRRGAENILANTGVLIRRNYKDVEIWKCRK